MLSEMNGDATDWTGILPPAARRQNARPSRWRRLGACLSFSYHILIEQ
jgi:hypothetical protein